MDSYLIAKYLHILSAVVVAGTGAGIAFFMLMGARSNDPRVIYVTAKNVILGDWIFTTPAIIVQLGTGLILMIQLDYSFHSPWFYAVAGLFIFIGACWLPVLKIQYDLKHLANRSLDGVDITPQFERLMRIWAILGIFAFAAILVIFWLMIVKPLPMI